MAVCQPDTSACTSPLGALSESAMRIALFCLSLLTGACRGDPEALAAASRAQLPADDGFATRLCHATLDQTRLQVDMRRKLAAYPKQWGLKQPDTNIDHRRVPNLETFFRRRSAALPVSARPARYQPGDLMTCTVAGRLPHIAIVVRHRTAARCRGLFTTSARARSWKTGCSNSRSPATTFGAASERRRARRCIQSLSECENARHFVLRSVLARSARLPRQTRQRTNR
jgi:hypothetical protein